MNMTSHEIMTEHPIRSFNKDINLIIENGTVVIAFTELIFILPIWHNILH
ncbi:hypothetical protein M4L39_01000 [Staphylococcus equorum]|nr:hypothetical protein [Staphylococcus equorum]MDG0842002.1 hypothetical protein [Staphylococcus equorum]